QHVEAFVKRAKEGFYNGTQVYAVATDSSGNPMSFEAGSKASGLKEKGGVEDPAEQSPEEPGDTIESEDTRNLIRHQYRVVTAVRMDCGESASRFLVVTRREGLTKLDGQQTPFAAVMDREGSLATIDKIGRATTYGTNPETKEAEGIHRMHDHP